VARSARSKTAPGVQRRSGSARRARHPERRVARGGRYGDVVVVVVVVERVVDVVRVVVVVDVVVEVCVVLELVVLDPAARQNQVIP
jgi:hypothetical protein